jgi:hypothetical protein
MVSAMTASLSAMRLKARAIALVVALLYLVPLLAPVLPAAASAEDAAFAEAVRAGIICAAPDPAAASPGNPAQAPAPARNHAADHCSLCVTGCASGSAAPPQTVARIAHPRLVALPAAPRTDRADPPGLSRPASDVAARAPPARALA